MSIVHRGVGLVVFAACGALGAPAYAAPDGAKQACIDAHADGQALRKSGRLVSAAEAFSTCARESCPRIVQAECVTWLGELEATTPTVVFDATDANGATLAAVNITVDGRRVASRLDGRAVPVDPGERVFVFEDARGRRQEQRVLVLEGERNHKVRAMFGPPSTPGEGAAGGEQRTETARRGPPWGAYVLGAVGIGGLAGFATFGALGKAQQSELDDCRGACSDRAYDVMRNRYIVADVSLGIAVTSFVAAVLVWQLADNRR